MYKWNIEKSVFFILENEEFVWIFSPITGTSGRQLAGDIILETCQILCFPYAIDINDELVNEINRFVQHLIHNKYRKKRVSEDILMFSRYLNTICSREWLNDLPGKIMQLTGVFI